MLRCVQVQWPEEAASIACTLVSHLYDTARGTTPCRNVSGCAGTVLDCAMPLGTVPPHRPDIGTSLMLILADCGSTMAFMAHPTL